MKLASFVNRPWKIAVLAILALVIYVPASYVVPDSYLMEVTGTEVRRAGSETGTDHYYVRSKFVEDDGTLGDIFVSRNFDNLFYMKWTSSDIQGELDALARCPGNRAIIRYYGWRWQFFSLFPNVTSIVEVVDRGNCSGTPAPAN